MRSALLLLLIGPALAQEEPADVFAHPRSGLSVTLPEGWDRQSSRESETLVYYAMLDLSPSKYVVFTVEMGPAGTFDGKAWLDLQQKQIAPAFKETTQPFIVDPTFQVAGRETSAYVVEGMRVTGSGTEYGFRVRAAALVHGEFLFKFTEASYNGAHAGRDAELAAMWAGVALGKPDLYAGGPTKVDAPEGAKPVDIVDEEANFKVVLHAGWRVTQPPPESGATGTRVRAERVNSEGAVLAELVIRRLVSTRAETFTIDSPTDVLERNQGFLDSVYGSGAGEQMRPDVNEGVGFGGAPRAGQFRYEAIPFPDQARVDQARELADRGDAHVIVPEYKPVVVRGRIGLQSPGIYIAWMHFSDRTVAEDEGLNAEYDRIMSSFALLSDTPLPSPLRVGGRRLKSTVDDPANAKARPEERVYSEKERKTHRLQLEYEIPPGWIRVKEGEGGHTTLVLAAQDKENNWILLTVFNTNFLRIGEGNRVPRDKSEYFEQWAVNWDSKARSARIPRRPGSVRIGRVKGKGYEEMPGSVEGFPGTFTGVLSDKSNWRTILEVETRGKGHEIFADGLKAFGKSFKVMPLKK